MKQNTGNDTNLLKRGQEFDQSKDVSCFSLTSSFLTHVFVLCRINFCGRLSRFSRAPCLHLVGTPIAMESLVRKRLNRVDATSSMIKVPSWTSQRLPLAKRKLVVGQLREAGNGGSMVGRTQL